MGVGKKIIKKNYRNGVFIHHRMKKWKGIIISCFIYGMVLVTILILWNIFHIKRKPLLYRCKRKAILTIYYVVEVVTYTTLLWINFISLPFIIQRKKRGTKRIHILIKLKKWNRSRTGYNGKKGFTVWYRELWLFNKRFFFLHLNCLSCGKLWWLFL